MSSEHSPYFSASYDTTTKLVSGFVCAILILVAVFVRIHWVAALLCVAVLGSYAWSPRGYSFADRSVLVHRLAGKARIPLDGAREIRRAQEEDFTGCIRTFGSGGMFGYFGIFRTSKLGMSHWYLTNRDNAVVILTADKTCLVSPDDTDDFLAAARAVAPAAGTVPAAAFDARTAKGRWIGPAIGIGIGVLVLAVVALALLYSPGPPAYSLTASSLVIHDRFYPVTLTPAEVDLARVRVVNLDTESGWRAVARTNGFANSHYASGHFRVANGQSVRLYQAGGRRLVLLPPAGNGTPVLLETRDPESFVVELQRLWR